MNKDVTNGMLRAIEAQLRAVEHALKVVQVEGDLTDDAYVSLSECYIDLINLNQRLLDVRGWNSAK